MYYAEISFKPVPVSMICDICLIKKCVQKVRGDRSSMNLALELKDNIRGSSCYLLSLCRCSIISLHSLKLISFLFQVGMSINILYKSYFQGNGFRSNRSAKRYFDLLCKTAEHDGKYGLNPKKH